PIRTSRYHDWRNSSTTRSSGSNARLAHGCGNAGSKTDLERRRSFASIFAACPASSSRSPRNGRPRHSELSCAGDGEARRKGGPQAYTRRSIPLVGRDASMAETVTIHEKPLRHFCEQVLVKLGVPEEDARVTTDVLVVADLRGIDSHGVARLGRYVGGLKDGYMKPKDASRIIKETKATALMDGGQGLGQVVGKKGMDLAITKAKDTAVGVVAVRNSNHYGIAGYYAMMALDHDLIGVSMTNAAPLVVPTFGRTSI